MAAVDLSALRVLKDGLHRSCEEEDVMLEVKTALSTQHMFQLPLGIKGINFGRSDAAVVGYKLPMQMPAPRKGAVEASAMPFAPAEFVHPANPAIRMAHGTTTMSFLFKGGVCIAVDSRASMGSYIGSGTVEKVIKISKYLLGTMAGGAADCSFWERQLAYHVKLYELREGDRISVAAASKLLANTVYGYKGYGLSMGTMIAGWDKAKGPELYYVDSDGTRLKGDKFCVGSGATYAYGILDTEYKYDMDLKEAVELGKRSIWHATHRDAYSGGTINVFVITADGWKQYFRGDMNELYYGQYAEERRKQNEQDNKAQS